MISMANNYDKILKENINELIFPLAHKVLGLDFSQMEDVAFDLQTTLERKPDFIKKVNQGNEIYLLHLEFQTTDETGMIHRMLVYFALLWQKHQMPIKQFVFFIGDETPKMSKKHPQIEFEFELIDVKNIDYQVFIDSDIPEEMILAILGNFKGQNPETIIKEILEKLKTQSKSLEKYIIQLEVLSNLRNLQPQTIKQLNLMAIKYDIEKDVRFQQGIEKGIEKGIEQEKIINIKAMLASGFLSVAQIAQIASVSVDFVLQIQQEMKQN